MGGILMQATQPAAEPDLLPDPTTGLDRDGFRVTLPGAVAVAYPPEAVAYPPEAVSCPPEAVSYPPPGTVSCPPEAGDSGSEPDIPVALLRASCYLEILIPSRDEARRLPYTLTRTIEYLEAQPYSSSVVVIDNDSVDQTSI